MQGKFSFTQTSVADLSDSQSEKFSHYVVIKGVLLDVY